MKISIIGAGNVGATAAQMIAKENLADEIVLLDVREGVAEGKAMDIMQSMMNAPKNYIHDATAVVRGVTNDYAATAMSDIVIITSGIPRKPGMTREELIGVNSDVMKSVVDSLAENEGRPDTKYIIVSNPMDSMTELVHRLRKDKNPHDIIGMGGLLDSARFKYYIREALETKRLKELGKGYKPEDKIDAYVVGGHGDITMIPLLSSATVNGISVKEIFSDEILEDIVTKTMRGGATMTSLLGTSAWVAPAQAITKLVRMIVLDTGDVCTCSVPVETENMCIGQFVAIDRNGWTKLEGELMSEQEQTKFDLSTDAVRKTNEALKY